MSFSALFMAVLQGVASFFKWKALESEIHLKLLYLDTLEKYDDDERTITSEVESLRAAGLDHAADRLRERYVRRQLLRATVSARLSLLEERPDNSDSQGSSHPADRRDMGEAPPLSAP